MIKILSKIDGINNVLENNNLLEIEFEKNNIIKIFNELKDNTEINFNQLLRKGVKTFDVCIRRSA